MLMALTDADLAMTESAQTKMSELFKDVDAGVEGVRVYAAAGGCSGVSFGMTFADSVSDNDGVREYGGYKVIVDGGTLPHLRGVEIDFVDRGDGNATFVFNNLPSSDGGCGSCGSSTSSGGGCS